MRTMQKIAGLILLGISAMSALAGCHASIPTPPLGQQNDAIWRRQETAASASDFVIYEHEFRSGDARLNLGGQDHLQSIAARLKSVPALAYAGPISAVVKSSTVPRQRRRLT